VLHREALDVGLVDDGAVERRARRLVLAPLEGAVDDDGARRAQGRRLAHAQVGVLAPAGRVREATRLPALDAVDGARVGVEQHDVGVEAQALARRPGPRGAEPVTLPGPEARHVAVPHVARALGQRCARLVAVGVEEAQLDGLRVLREDGEVDTLPSNVAPSG